MAKILIVDDSKTARYQLRKLFEANGYDIVEAEDGAIGLERLAQFDDISLILCDVNMPNMDGLTMCAKVHEQEGKRDIPIFMLTAESGAEFKSKAKGLGVKAWVTKPFLADKLLAAVNKLTNKV